MEKYTNHYLEMKENILQKVKQIIQTWKVKESIPISTNIVGALVTGPWCVASNVTYTK